MAEIKSFPNNKDEFQGAEDVMRWLHGRTSGVFAAQNNLAVTALSTPGMAVTVSDGTGWMSNNNKDGVVFWNDNTAVNGSPLQLSIDAADGVLNRIDRIIVEWQTTNYVDLPQIKVLKGTPGSTASAPALTNNSTKRQISLARVNVAAGTTSITATMITDERLDPAVCGLVTEAISADTSVINQQYNDALAQLRRAIDEAWSGEISEGAVSTVYTATIPTEWSGSNAPYSKAVTINGIMALDQPIIDLSPSSDYETAEPQIEQWGYVYRADTAANKITFFATEKPDVALPVKVRCIRK